VLASRWEKFGCLEKAREANMCLRIWFVNAFALGARRRFLPVCGRGMARFTIAEGLLISKLEVARMRLAEPFLDITRRSKDLGVRDVQRMLIRAFYEWSPKSLLALNTQNYLYADLGD